MSRLRPLVALAALAAVVSTASPAAAQPPTTPYVGLTLFLVGLTDSEFRDTSIASVEGDLETDTGLGAALAIGARSRAGIRFEAEAAYRRNENDQLDLPGLDPIALDGGLDSLALMGNVVLEPSFRDFPLRPYLGGGVGAARVAFDSDQLDEDDSDWVFAYQGMTGVTVDLGRSFGIFGGYRYFATDDPVIAGTDIEYRSHNLEAGLRFWF